MGKIRLFPKEGGERRVFIALQKGKAIILTVTYTNSRFAEQLADAGVPLIADESPEESKQKFLAKKLQFAWRNGRRKSKPLEIPEGTSVSGNETLGALTKIASKESREAFLRTRQRLTERGVAKKGRPKFVTKLYLIPEGKADFEDEGGTKKVKPKDLPGLLGELLDAAWFIHARSNPESSVIALTSRQPQPGKSPTHTIS